MLKMTQTNLMLLEFLHVDTNKFYKCNYSKTKAVHVIYTNIIFYTENRMIKWCFYIRRE